MTTEMSESAVKMNDAVHLFPWWLLLLQGIVSLILGIMFLVYPMGTLFIMVTFLGAYWFVSGIFALVGLLSDRSHAGTKSILALLGIAAGILILVYPFYSTIVVPEIFIIMIAIWGIFMGCISILASFKGGGIGAAIMGALAVIFGCIILFNPLITVLFLPLVLGIFGIAGGIATLILALHIRRETGAV